MDQPRSTEHAQFIFDLTQASKSDQPEIMREMLSHRLAHFDDHPEGTLMDHVLEAWGANTAKGRAQVQAIAIPYLLEQQYKVSDKNLTDLLLADLEEFGPDFLNLRLQRQDLTRDQKSVSFEHMACMAARLTQPALLGGILSRGAALCYTLNSNDVHECLFALTSDDTETDAPLAVDCLEYLAQIPGFDINWRNERHETALMTARWRCVSLWLLEHGADPMAHDAKGKSVLYHAWDNDAPGDTIVALLEHGATLDSGPAHEHVRNFQDLAGSRALLAAWRRQQLREQGGVVMATQIKPSTPKI